MFFVNSLSFLLWLPKTVLITTTESMAQTAEIAGVMPKTSTGVNSFFVLNGSMALNKSIYRPCKDSTVVGLGILFSYSSFEYQDC